MAVDPRERGKGYGDALIRAAIELARKDGAETVYLLSNTVLKPAIALYRKHGFHSLSEGPHPVYVRCNIVIKREASRVDLNAITQSQTCGALDYGPQSSASRCLDPAGTENVPGRNPAQCRMTVRPRCREAPHGKRRMVRDQA